MIAKRTPLLLLLVASVLLTIFATASPAQTQGQTVGLLLNKAGAFGGYTLIPPLTSTTTYLIDSDGRVVHTWESDYPPTATAYLLENGNLLRTARMPQNTNPAFPGWGGRVEEFTWDGDLVWEFEYSDDEHRLHHDIERLPNGNILMISWEYRSGEEALAAGRDPELLPDGELWPDSIIEVEPTGASGGNIVWEWHAWDHLVQDYDAAADNYGVVAGHPELIDINVVDEGGRADWHHANGLDYNAEFDQIILSVRAFNEFWVIDHSTTTEEAAGHTGGDRGKGGDLIYRWGNPENYGADADQRLFRQHDAQWIDPGLPGEGNILVFNNGDGRRSYNFSSVDELAPPVDGQGNYALTLGEPYEPGAAFWMYADPPDFYSSIISGAQRLPNGNTLILDGVHGTIFEVNMQGTVLWKYVSPVTATGPLRQGDPVPPFSNFVHRVFRYGPDYPGLQGRDLTPGGVIELPPEGPKVSPTSTHSPTSTLTPTATSTPTSTPSPTPSRTPTPAGACGDANGDGRVNSIDALTVLQYGAGLLQVLPDPERADANGDGAINSLDAALIAQFEAALLTELTC